MLDTEPLVTASAAALLASLLARFGFHVPSATILNIGTVLAAPAVFFLRRFVTPAKKAAAAVAAVEAVVERSVPPVAVK